MRLVLAALLLAGNALAATAPAPAAGVEQLGWLSGCWQSTAAGTEAGSVEMWTTPDGGTLLGLSRTVRGGRTSEYEYMRIGPDAHGRLAFHAQPSGQPATLFPLLRLDADEVVFENAGHDFPQRVAYRRDGADRVVGRIEGRSGGKDKVIEFPLRRVGCGGGMAP